MRNVARAVVRAVGDGRDTVLKNTTFFCISVSIHTTAPMQIKAMIV